MIVRFYVSALIAHCCFSMRSCINKAFLQICFGEGSASKLHNWAQKHYTGGLQLTVSQFGRASVTSPFSCLARSSHSLPKSIQGCRNSQHPLKSTQPHSEKVCMHAEFCAAKTFQDTQCVGQEHSRGQPRQPHSRSAESCGQQIDR